MDYRDINLPTDGKWDLIFQAALCFNFFCFFFFQSGVMGLGEWGVSSLDINARFASGRLLVSNLAICALLWVISLWSSSFIILFDSTLFGLFVSVTSQPTRC